MKLKNKLLSLGLIAATSSIAIPCAVSCNSSTINVQGAIYDAKQSSVELEKDSTFFLKRVTDSKITGIKSITIDKTVLVKSAYSLQYVEDGNAKLTIIGKMMTSLNITIIVNNNDMFTISSVGYSGSTLTEAASLKPDALDIKAKYKGQTTEYSLSSGEYQVFKGEENITDKVVSADGYKITTAGTYTFTIKATIDATKTKDFNLTVTDRTSDYYYEAFDYTSPVADECLIKLRNFTVREGTTEIAPIPKIMLVNGVKKKVTGIAANSYTADTPAGKFIKEIRFEDPSQIKYIQTGAFNYCSALTTITIPTSVVKIEPKAFENCTALASATFADTVGWKQIDGSAITIGTAAENAAQLKECTTSTSWGTTGIEKQ